MENFLIQCINLYVYSLVGVVKVTYLLRMAEITSGSSFEPNNPAEQKLRFIFKSCRELK